MYRRRVWSEFLPATQLATPATISLLSRYKLEPLIAWKSDTDASSMIEALARLREAGVPIGVWPLLSDEHGYWPGVENAPHFVQRVRELVGVLDRSKIRIATLAVDLEPPLARKRELLDASMIGRLGLGWRRLREIRRPGARQQIAQANASYQTLATGLRQREIESLVVVVAPLVLDLAAGTRFWQCLLGTPLASSWKTLSPMLYTSMIRQLLPMHSEGLTRALFAALCEQLAALGTESSCLSLGVVGSGKWGNEVGYECVDQLANDVSCASAMGFEDLALFSLEGILAKPNPEAWLEVFTSARPVTPAPVLLKAISRALLQAGIALTPRS